ncbi:MAG TPA: hypothetical protein VF412_06250 [Bdellovibrio sp.]|uniref:hypothetical protein n=1 Tax=Bdellovibrio sp. TaxID=28201 RepID=UPI002F0D404A
MKEEKPLSRLLIETAVPAMAPMSGLTSEEILLIEKDVDFEVRKIAQTLPGDNRSSFVFTSENRITLKSRMAIDRFNGQPLKLKQALSLVSTRLNDWEWFIRKSQGFAYMEQASALFEKQ